jgi:hypothetical protein
MYSTKYFFLDKASLYKLFILSSVLGIVCISCSKDVSVNERPTRIQADLGADVECRSDLDCLPTQTCISNQCLTDTSVDTDRDGVPDNTDNCPYVINEDQNDCDRNGVGDPCDPAGICGVEFAGEVFRFDSVKGKMILACTYLEFERTNIRLQVSNSGSYNVKLPSSFDNPRINIYSGYVIGTGGDRHCSAYNKTMYSAFEQKALNSAYFTLNLDTMLQQQEILSINIPETGHLYGRVLLSDQSPYQAVHGSIRVFIKGYEKTATLTDRYGYFKIAHIPATEHIVVIHHEEYGTLEIDEVTVVANQTTWVNHDPARSVCRTTLNASECLSNSEQLASCERVCDQASDCVTSNQLCADSLAHHAIYLSPHMDHTDRQQMLTITTTILTPPVDLSSHRINPKPTVTISPTFEGNLQTFDLEYSENQSDSYNSVYTWSGMLNLGELYQFIVDAGDENRIMMARIEGFSLDKETRDLTTNQLNFFLRPFSSQLDGTFDEDIDDILDQDDEDQDGDGCLDELDRYPRNPYACVDENEDGIPDEWQNDLNQNNLTDLEDIQEGQDGVQTLLFDTGIYNDIQELTPQLSIISGDSDRVSSVSLAHVALPYAYPYPSIAKATLVPLRLSINSGDEDLSLRYKFYLDETFNDLQKPKAIHPYKRIMFAHEACSLNIDSDSSEENESLCEIFKQLIRCSDEQTINHRSNSCYTEINIPASKQGEYLLWLTDDLLISDMVNSTMNDAPTADLVKKCDVCLARNELPQSIYGLIHRTLLVDEACPKSYSDLNLSLAELDVIEDLSPAAISALAFKTCTPLSYKETTISDANCRPVHLYTSQVDPLIMTSLQIRYLLNAEQEEQVTTHCGSLGIDWQSPHPVIQLTNDCLSQLEALNIDLELEILFTLSDGGYNYQLVDNASEIIHSSEPSVIRVSMGDINGICK